MLTFPDLNPVALSIGPVNIHWYGVMYLVGFIGGWWLARLRARTQPHLGWKASEIEDLLFYVALGVIAGGRIGYILFYGLGEIAEDPLRILRIWEGGMSFHGGLIGVLIAMALYAKRTERQFFQVADFVAPLVPVGLFAGRIANFINAELWGGPTNLPVGMSVPCDRAVDLCERVGSVSPGLSSPVHPSQLYEAGLEGILLFLILWFFSARHRPTMAVSGLFLLGYGAFRMVVETVRMPDAHIGYLAGEWLTMGMLLTLPMIVAGIVIIFLAYRNKESSREAIS